jgi:hypothetical protein
MKPRWKERKRTEEPATSIGTFVWWRTQKPYPRMDSEPKPEKAHLMTGVTREGHLVVMDAQEYYGGQYHAYRLVDGQEMDLCEKIEKVVRG